MTKYEDMVPSWFLRYEKKNIDYTSLLYKLSVAYNLVYNNLLSFDNDLIQTLASEVNISDEGGILTPFYLQCLGMAAKLKYCDSGCISLDDDGIISRHRADLRFIEKLDGDIRKAFVTQILVLLYNSSGTLPDSIALQLESEVASSDYALRLETYKNPDIADKAAPNFYLKDTSDKFHSLKDFKGNTLLLNFWFVGCKPCHQEIPFEKRLVKELMGTSFQLINICMTSDEDAWKNLVEREELPGTNLFANDNWTEKISKEYNIIGYPRYVLVDANGIVIDGKCRRPSNSELIPYIKKYLGN